MITLMSRVSFFVVGLFFVNRGDMIRTVDKVKQMSQASTSCVTVSFSAIIQGRGQTDRLLHQLHTVD